MEKSGKSDRYMVGVIVAGAICVIAALSMLPVHKADLYLLLLSVFTIAVGSRVTVQIPRFQSHISVSDTFIFLVLLIYGGEFAVALAAIEAFASAWRFCTRKLTVFFNAATMAVSTSMVVLVLRLMDFSAHGEPTALIANDQRFITALCVVALVQFLCNTIFASVHGALRDGIPLWETWKSKYVWTFFSYFIGAASAGVLVRLAGLLGMGVIVAVFPVIFFVFLSYKMYLKNVEISIKQAEQAEEYAKILETQSDALRESEERFRSAFDYAPIGIGLVSSSGRWLKANRALSDILGYSEREFLESDFQSVIYKDDLGLTLVKVHQLISGRIHSCQMEQRFVHKTGRIVWASWSVSAANDSKSKQPNLIFQIQDITDRKVAEEKLQHEASHDALTGLPNRAYFMTRLGDALTKVRELQGYRVSVLFIDLDRFKYVNDSLGHLVGDELLKGISDRLRECMRPSDIVARLGGDEFTLLVEGRYDPEEVTRIADRVQKKFTEPFGLLGHEVYSSASIGILHASDKHLSPEDMMRDADTAMYQAKRAGKARYATFDEEMHSAAREILQLETDLRRALERHEISVVYQPIYTLSSGAIEGVEALARWEHPTLGCVLPAKFIPLAEEIGLIDKLCEQVLRQACNDIGSLRGLRSNASQISLSINLSCRQFAQSALVQGICGILDETGFQAKNLRIEITESVFFEHADRAVEMLSKLRGMGVDIYIDDFGTGYSNLSYLTKLPISTLKIDRSFVSLVDDDGGNEEIVKAIVNLARNLKLRVIAEGIETSAQLKMLKALECEAGQGYYFSRPLTINELKQMLNHESLDLPIPKPFDEVPTIAMIQ